MREMSPVTGWVSRNDLNCFNCATIVLVRGPLRPLRSVRRRRLLRGFRVAIIRSASAVRCWCIVSQMVWMIWRSLVFFICICCDSGNHHRLRDIVLQMHFMGSICQRCFSIRRFFNCSNETLRLVIAFVAEWLQKPNVSRPRSRKLSQNVLSIRAKTECVAGEMSLSRVCFRGRIFQL